MGTEWTDEEREVVRRGGLDPDAVANPKRVDEMERRDADDERQLAEIVAKGGPELARVLAALSADCEPIEIYGWLMTPDPDLEGMSVLEWVRAGRSPRPALPLTRALECDV